MKIYCLLFLIALPFVTFGQAHSSISIMGSIDYTYRNLEKSEFHSEESAAKIKYRFGISIAIKLSDRISLEVGGRYVKHGYKYLGKVYQYGSDHNGMGGFELMLTDLHRSGFSYTHTFIELPFNIKYLLKASKLNPYLTIGFAPNFYQNTRTDVEYGGEELTKSFKSSKLNDFTLSAIIGFGFDYLIPNNYALFMQPTLRYQITNFSNSTYSEHLYSVGLEIGIRKNLN